MQKTNKVILLVLAVFSTGLIAAQQAVDSIPETPSEIPVVTLDTVETIAKDTVKEPFQRIKLDGISAVIGDYVILDSDIEKALIDLKSQGVSTEDITKCELLGKLMEDRLYAHQAVQDSLLVSDDEVAATSDRQLQSLVQQVGSMEKVLK